MGDVIMVDKDWKSILSGVIGLLVLIFVLQAVLPSLFEVSTGGSNLSAENGSAANPAGHMANESVWGAFGSAVLPVIFGLLVAVGALYLIFNGIMSTFGIGKGKGKGGYGL